MNDAHSGRSYAEGEPDGGQDPYAGQRYHDPHARQPYDVYPQQEAPYYAPPDQPRPPQQTYDPYGQAYYDPYGRPQPPDQPRPPQQTGGQWIPHQQSYESYEAYGRQVQAPVPPPQQAPVPPPQQAPGLPRQQPRPPAGAPAQPGRPPRDRAPSAGPGGDYHTEQFAFVEDPDEDAEDVIDWLKFAETRTERRDERRRKYRNRVTALVVVLVLALAGGVGYLWFSGGLSSITEAGSGPAEGGPQKRDVIVVHLRDTGRGGGSSTALLVANQTTGKGTTVLLPNALVVSTDDGGSTTLGKSVEDEGTTSTRDSLDTLLGADIKGSWRLDTPYLENLVESVGGIVVDTDTTVPGEKKGDDPLVERGKGQDLSGQAAVAYATHRGAGEQQTRQLQRFGQVLQATLKKLSSDTGSVTEIVRSLNQIPDPSLTEAQLGASLAQLAEEAKTGAYGTAALTVRPDGTLSEDVSRRVVEDVLGGTVRNADPDAAPRVGVRNATGDGKSLSGAQVALVNGGYTFMDAGAADAVQATSRVTYAEPAQVETAREVAKTLGLPESAVEKGQGAANADVTVVLGQDYRVG